MNTTTAKCPYTSQPSHPGPVAAGYPGKDSSQQWCTMTKKAATPRIPSSPAILPRFAEPGVMAGEPSRMSSSEDVIRSTPVSGRCGPWYPPFFGLSTGLSLYGRQT